jgi:hypothetical protein
MELDFNQGNTTYIIDTSGLITLEFIFKYDNPVFSAIWEEIEELIKQGTFKPLTLLKMKSTVMKGKRIF